MECAIAEAGLQNEFQVRVSMCTCMYVCMCVWEYVVGGEGEGSYACTYECCVCSCVCICVLGISSIAGLASTVSWLGKPQRGDPLFAARMVSALSWAGICSISCNLHTCTLAHTHLCVHTTGLPVYTCTPFYAHTCTQVYTHTIQTHTHTPTHHTHLPPSPLTLTPTPIHRHTCTHTSTGLPERA